MAVGRVLTLYITHLSITNRISRDSTKARNHILHKKRVYWKVGSTGSVDGEQTHRLFKVWDRLVVHLGLTPGGVEDTAVSRMGELLRRLYKTYQDDDPTLAADCLSITKDFRINVAEVAGSKSHYLLIMEHDLPLLLPAIYPFNMAMYCQDITESINCILKNKL